MSVKKKKTLKLSVDQAPIVPMIMDHFSKDGKLYGMFYEVRQTENGLSVAIRVDSLVIIGFKLESPSESDMIGYNENDPVEIDQSSMIVTPTAKRNIAFTLPQLGDDGISNVAEDHQSRSHSPAPNRAKSAFDF